MRVKWNKVLKSLLKSAVYVMDQTAEQVDRASDRSSGVGCRSPLGAPD